MTNGRLAVSLHECDYQTMQDAEIDRKLVKIMEKLSVLEISDAVQKNEIDRIKEDVSDIRAHIKQQLTASHNKLDQLIDTLPRVEQKGFTVQKLGVWGTIGASALYGATQGILDALHLIAK